MTAYWALYLSHLIWHSHISSLPFRIYIYQVEPLHHQVWDPCLCLYFRILDLPQGSAMWYLNKFYLLGGHSPYASFCSARQFPCVDFTLHVLSLVRRSQVSYDHEMDSHIFHPARWIYVFCALWGGSLSLTIPRGGSREISLRLRDASLEALPLPDLLSLVT